MPVILLFGIYGGATTPTEAAAIAAFYALLVATFLYRAVSFRVLYGVLSESARATASVGLVIGASLIFNYIVAVGEHSGARWQLLMKGLNVSPLVFLLGVNLLFLVLGCLLDATTIILVIIPLFIPTCKALGIDLVHFGVTAVVNCMIGLITPPYGVLLFVINAITGIPLKTIIAAIWPYIGGTGRVTPGHAARTGHRALPAEDVRLQGRRRLARLICRMPEARCNSGLRGSASGRISGSFHVTPRGLGIGVLVGTQCGSPL